MLQKIKQVKNAIRQQYPFSNDRVWRATTNFIAFFFQNNLNALARIYGTDKHGSHFYTPHYTEHFERFKNKRLQLLEIGVGGNNHPERGGGSLRMWRAFFPHAKIFALDIFDKSPHQERRIKIFKGDQGDATFLRGVAKEVGVIDIIIDDGSHQNHHVINTFTTLFPLLKEGGIYVIEDTQTSYWPSFGGDSKNMSNPATMMNFFKKLTDGVNYREFAVAYQPNYFDEHIISMHFYHNLLFIYKGKNDEASNCEKYLPSEMALDYSAEKPGSTR